VRRRLVSVSTGMATLDARDGNLQTLAELLVPAARNWPGMTGLVERRWGRLSAVASSFEAWVIGWPPSSVIELHDHGDSAGAVAVVSGVLEETSVIGHVGDHVATSTRIVSEGGSIRFARGHVHGVVNPATSTALSVHVYSPRLTRMNRYRIESGILRSSGSVRCDLGQALP
jgi:hypothetical protein